MRIDDKLHEECAVFGVSLTKNDAVGITYNGLLSLQHRGQEGAGIAIVGEDQLVCHKQVGLVSEVFPEAKLAALPRGRTAVGHTRYSTTGSNTPNNAGPFVTDYLTGRIAVSHNGNVTNARDIRDELRTLGLQFDATCDSEVISCLIAYCITQAQDTLTGVAAAARKLRGAFSLVIATGRNQLIALRDTDGFRPLCIGHNDIGYAVASESCALDACGFTLDRNLLPGEVVVMENGSISHEGPIPAYKRSGHGLCIFEYVYFARPDSVIDGLSVYQARHNMGRALAQEYPVDADIVCGVPDSGLDAASGYAAASGIPLASGFVKNRYIGRSFIYPTQTQRDSAVKLKLNPLAACVEGKRIVLVDDSIVRGTTSEKIVRSLKNAKAAEVHMRISSPPFRYTCHYGTDIDSEENLIANRMTLEQIRRQIGADSLGFISTKGLKSACAACTLPFCTACFTGNGARLRDKKGALE